MLHHNEGDDRKHRAALFLLERTADCYGYGNLCIDLMNQWKCFSSLSGREVCGESVKKIWTHVLTETSAEVELTDIREMNKE